MRHVRRRRSDPLSAARGAAERFRALDNSDTAWPGVYWGGWVRTRDERSAARHLADALLGLGRTDVTFALAQYLRRAREVARETGRGSWMHVAAEDLFASVN